MPNLNKECDKVASTLLSFVGRLVNSPSIPATDTSVEEGKLPPEAITNAKGLAIFSAFRAGMMFAGTAGSGVVVARLADGSWSPPSVFSVKSGGFGLVYGVNYFDCVCVLNNEAAVDAYRSPEVTLGGRLDLAAGPVGGALNTGKTSPLWTYTRSRGLYGGVALDGTSIKEQREANAESYGKNIAAAQILRGKGVQWPAGASKLRSALVTLDQRKS